MLKRVYVDNYKCFVNSEIVLDSDAVLVAGTNGAGKSTFFEILELLRDLVGRGASIMSETQPNGLRFLGETYTRWKKSIAPTERSQHFELVVEDNGGEYLYKLTLDDKTKGGMPRICKEELSFDGHTLFLYADSMVHLFDNATYEEKVQFGADWSRSFIPSVTDRVENAKLIRFRDWIRNITVLRPNPWTISGVAGKENQFLLRDFSNFASWFRYLKQTVSDRRYEMFLQEVRHAVDGLQGIRMNPIGDSAMEIKLQFGVKDDNEYTLGELSEGQRLLLALYATIHFGMNKASLFCIDEPDNFLAIGEINPIVETLFNSDAEAQVFVSSHNAEIFNHVSGESGIYFSRRENVDGSATRVKPFKDVLAGNPGLSNSEIFKRGWEV